MREQFILEIEWDYPSSDSPKLPPLVGPFTSRMEARGWAHLNIPNGSYEIRPLGHPYLGPTLIEQHSLASSAPATESGQA